MEPELGDPQEAPVLSPSHRPIELPNGKRRWRRNRVACDNCHVRRVRCDRAFPCQRCLRGELSCKFTRELRKRGRIARAKLPTDPTSTRRTSNGSSLEVSNENLKSKPSPSRAPSLVPALGQHSPVTNDMSSSTTGLDALHTAQDGHVPNRTSRPQPNITEEWLSRTHLSPDNYDAHGATNEYEHPSPNLDAWNPTGPRHSTPQPVNHLPGRQAPGSKDCPEATSTRRMGLKYPVLEPVMPYLDSNLSPRLVSELLELYFTSAFSTHMHPVCHHIHCYVLRKASFLDTSRPRPSSPALLASMLWVAAVDDRAFGLSLSPLQRRKICHSLCALTVRLLRPLTHVSFKDQGYTETTAGPHDFTAATTQHPFEGVGDDKGLVGPAGSLDDVITYIHIASIISSSEQKAASMRWWHAAFTLARELKLNQEIERMPSSGGAMEESWPPLRHYLGDWEISPEEAMFDDSKPTQPALDCVCDESLVSQSNEPVTEEHREERRRTWWLLYIMDRHLALCYNRPLALLDAESEDLLLPLDEAAWQAGNIHSNSPRSDGPQCSRSGDQNKRRVFPNFICHDHSILGFFLPLMTITGELIDLNQARNHPTLGLRLQGRTVWDVHLNEVLRQLEIYKASLTTFTVASGAEPDRSNPNQADDPQLPQAYPWHTQTVVAYASYLVHVLHILLVGKWDPVSLIEDKDFWTSSPAFASTISHALEAASAVQQILRYDADISFMPYFFGIQLLQGSFLLLLIVERLQQEAGEVILSACDTMIRATESCVVTLNTEYQRSFRQVMRSAVAQARGRPVNPSEIRHRRKAVLALYRWTRKGTGLAL